MMRPTINEESDCLRKTKLPSRRRCEVNTFRWNKHKRATKNVCITELDMHVIYTTPSTLDRWYYYISLLLLQFNLLGITIFSTEYSKSICLRSCVALMTSEDCYVVDMIWNIKKVRFFLTLDYGYPDLVFLKSRKKFKCR
jgi:hypothetical protein